MSVECPVGVRPGHVLRVVARNHLQAALRVAFAEYREEVRQQQLADPYRVGDAHVLSSRSLRTVSPTPSATTRSRPARCASITTMTAFCGVRRGSPIGSRIGRLAIRDAPTS